MATFDILGKIQGNLEVLAAPAEGDIVTNQSFGSVELYFEKDGVLTFCGISNPKQEFKLGAIPAELAGAKLVAARDIDPETIVVNAANAGTVVDGDDTGAADELGQDQLTAEDRKAKKKRGN